MELKFLLSLEYINNRTESVSTNEGQLGPHTGPLRLFENGSFWNANTLLQTSTMVVHITAAEKAIASIVRTSSLVLSQMAALHKFLSLPARLGRSLSDAVTR